MLLATGLVLGAAGALAVTRLLEGELFDIAATDPISWTGVVGVLAIATLVASVVPAWRAATVDPLVALRTE